MNKFLASSFLLAGFLCCLEVESFAATSAYVICSKKADGKITVRTKCTRSETKISNLSSLIGPTGAAGTNGTNGSAGADGEDGSIRIYGDGSLGALSVTGSFTVNSGDNQYSSITVESGGTLNIPSGTVIRCTGTFTNQGTVAVATFAAGGFIRGAASTFITAPAIAPPGSGLTLAPAAPGAYGTQDVNLFGGAGGVSYTQADANILRPGVNGGGGGAGSFSLDGGSGGGTVTIIANGAITNGGTISAVGGAGSAGSGGGGGGFVILASKTSVTNSGTITVVGGNGGASSTAAGAGGGGGGGLIRMISPTAPVNSGSATVLGGSAGSNAVAVTLSPRIGGGSGGSSIGQGGAGATVAATTGTSSGNSAGSSGRTILTTADPTSLF